MSSNSPLGTMRTAYAPSGRGARRSTTNTRPPESGSRAGSRTRTTSRAASGTSAVRCSVWNSPRSSIQVRSMPVVASLMIGSSSSFDSEVDADDCFLHASIDASPPSANTAATTHTNERATFTMPPLRRASSIPPSSCRHASRVLVPPPPSTQVLPNLPQDLRAACSAFRAAVFRPLR